MADFRLVERRTFLEVERAKGDASPLSRQCRALSDAEIEYGGAESDGESATTTTGSGGSPADALTTCSAAGMDSESVGSWAPGDLSPELFLALGLAGMDSEVVGSGSIDLLSECERLPPPAHIPGSLAATQPALQLSAVQQPDVWMSAPWAPAYGYCTQAAYWTPEAPVWQQGMPWQQNPPWQPDVLWQQQTELQAFSLSRPATRRRGRRRTGKSPEPPLVNHTITQQPDGTGLDVPENEWTTVIFRNMPPSVKRDVVVRALDLAGFSGEYDLVHVPVKFQDCEGIGYALVNAVDREAAKNIMRNFQGFAAWPVERRVGHAETQSLQVDAAWSVPLQGLAALETRYRDSPVMHDCVPDVFKPGLFNRQGLRIAFPPPTKKLKAPRMRRVHL